MCFDPVSIGLALAGTASSVGGGILNSGAQAKQASAQQLDNARAAAASNAVLAKFQDQQAVNQKANDAALAPAINFYNPATFQNNQTGIANTASSNAASAIASVLKNQPLPTLSNTDNGQSAAAIKSAIASRTGQSVLDATNAAKLGAYGTNLSLGGIAGNTAARGIDQTNTFARQQAQLLPTNEQNAALQARQVVPPADYTAGSALQGLGNLFSTLGGSGAGSKAISGVGNAISNYVPTIGSPSLS